MRAFDAVNSFLTVGIVGFALWAWPKLPARIPKHFGPDGQPDAWGETTLGSWLFIPVLALLIVGGIGWFRRVMPRKPGWVNLPDKTNLKKLPAVAREPVLKMMSGFLSLVQMEILVIFALIQFSTYRSAMGFTTQGLMILVLVISILASPFLLIVFFLRLQVALDRSKELAAALEGKTA